LIYFYKQTTSTIESNLEGLASVLDGDIQNFKKKVLKLLVECAVNMPEKCTIYSTLVGLLNAKNYNFGGEVSEYNIIKYYILIISKHFWRMPNNNHTIFFIFLKI